MANDSICKIDGCDKSSYRRGWCQAHYCRWKRHGYPLGGRSTMDGEPRRYFCDTVLTYEGDECLTWPFARYSDGTGQISVDGRMKNVPRLVCEAANGPPPSPDHQAAHKCGNGHMSCCAKRHLSWKIREDNEADKLVHGTHNRGEKHYGAKLTEGEVIAIRSLRGSMTQKAIAEKFGISFQHVGLIHRRIKWAWLT